MYITLNYCNISVESKNVISKRVYVYDTFLQPTKSIYKYELLLHTHTHKNA